MTSPRKRVRADEKASQNVEPAAKRLASGDKKNTAGSGTATLQSKQAIVAPPGENHELSKHKTVAQCQAQGLNDDGKKGTAKPNVDSSTVSEKRENKEGSENDGSKSSGGIQRNGGENESLQMQLEELNNEDPVSVTTMTKIVVDDLQSDDMGVLEEALAQLRNFLAVKDDQQRASNQQAFFRIGGHLAVVKALQNLSNREGSKTSTECAIRVLTNAAHHNDKLRIMIGKVRGVEAIISAMRRHPSEPRIVYEGLKSLGYLCSCLDNVESFGNTDGGVDFIVGTINACLQDVGIVEKGCLLLRRLCRVEESRRMLFNQKATSTLASIIECHESNLGIRSSAHKAIRLLTDWEPASVARSQLRNDDDSDRKLIFKHVLFDDITIGSCSLVQASPRKIWFYFERNHSVDSERLLRNQAVFYEIGGHLEIVRAMKLSCDGCESNKVDYGHQYYYCLCLQKLYASCWVLEGACHKNEELQSAVAYMNGMEAMVRAVKHFERYAFVALKGLEALEAIVDGHQQNAERLVTKIDGLPLISRVLVETRKWWLAESACKLVETLATFETLRKTLRDAGLENGLMQAMRLYPERDCCRSAGYRGVEPLESSSTITLRSISSTTSYGCYCHLIKAHSSPF